MLFFALKAQRVLDTKCKLQESRPSDYTVHVWNIKPNEKINYEKALKQYL